MFTRIPSFFNTIPSLFFNRKNKVNIICGLAVTTVNVGLDLLTPYVFTQTIIALGNDTYADLLGVEISPLVLTGVYGALWTINASASNLRNLIYAPIASRATKNLVDQFVHHTMIQSAKYHQETPLGDHLNRLMKCYMAMPGVSTQFFTQILPTSLEVAVAIGVLTKLYGKEVALNLFALVAVYTGYVILSRGIVTESRTEMLKHGIDCYDELGNIITHHQTIHEFNTLDYEEEKLFSTTERYAKAESIANMAVFKVGIGQNLIVGAGYTSMCLVIANEVINQRLTSTDFVTIATYFMQLAYPLLTMGTAISQFLASMTELNLVLDEMKKIPDVVDYFPDVKIKAAPNQAAKIEFRNVTFAYSDGKIILDNVSFVIEPGQKVGIVGASGAGKTTIGNLIFRFYDPTKGQILINDQDIKTVSLKSLRDTISIIPQAPVLFNDTLRANIVYARSANKAELKDEDVHAALKAACLDMFVAGLPLGLLTPVGERGAKLSGGQKQRVAIARGFFKSPSIYLIDEATSALDSKVEQSIQENLDISTKGITKVVITHKFSGIVNADNIIVLQNGKIIQTGTHESLSRIAGHYYDLYKRQNQNGEMVEAESEHKNDSVMVNQRSMNSRRSWPHFHRSVSQVEMSQFGFVTNAEEAEGDHLIVEDSVNLNVFK